MIALGIDRYMSIHNKCVQEHLWNLKYLSACVGLFFAGRLSL